MPLSAHLTNHFLPARSLPKDDEGETNLSSTVSVKGGAERAAFTGIPSGSEVETLLRALCDDNPMQDRRKFQGEISEESSETYAWIFADVAYTTWLNVETKPILWIHDEEGQSKTPLTISLINALTDKVERSSQRRALAYFFCVALDCNRNNATAMIRVLLYQLLCQQPHARKPWLREYQVHDERFLEKAECFDILWKVGLAYPWIGLTQYLTSSLQ